MNDRQRRQLAQMLDQVRVTRTVPFHWLYARYGVDGEAYLGVFRRAHEAQSVAFDLRREADRSKLVEGQVWFLDGEYVFRTTQPTDAGLRYGLDRNTTAGGVRDTHDWLRQGRYRVIGADGDPADPASWFADPDRGARVKAELEQLGVSGGGGSGDASAAGGTPAGLGDLSGLDTLDGLDGL